MYSRFGGTSCLLDDATFKRLLGRWLEPATSACGLPDIFTNLNYASDITLQKIGLYNNTIPQAQPGLYLGKKE